MNGGGEKEALEQEGGDEATVSFASVREEEGKERANVK